MVPRCLVQEPKNARPTKNSGIRFYRPSAINLLEYEFARSTLILYYDPIIRSVELGLENSKRSTKYGNNTSLGLVKEAMFKFLIQGDVLKFLFFSSNVSSLSLEGFLSSIQSLGFHPSRPLVQLGAFFWMLVPLESCWR